MFSIALIHHAALGDTILLLPLIRSLRLRFPDSSITLVTRDSFGQLLTGLGLLEACASADDPGHSLWFIPPRESPRPNSTPPWARADLLLSAVATPTDPWAANARLARPGRAPDSLLFFQPRPPSDFPHHVTAWHRAQLATLQLPDPPLLPPRANPDGTVLIHPGAGSDAKCWPRHHFLAIARALQQREIPAAFILGEVELARWPRDVIAQFEDLLPCLRLDLPALADALARARLYLGNDSGVTHLAAAMGIPTIALFGPSSDLHWRPVGPRVRVLRTPSP